VANLNHKPAKAMSEAPVKNYHKRTKSVNPDQMTILPDILDTPRSVKKKRSSIKIERKESNDQDALLYDNNGNKIYMGGLKNNMREGYGVEYKNICEDVSMPNNITNYAYYKGNWQRGFKNGEGKFTTFNFVDKTYTDIEECKIVKGEIESAKMEVFDSYFKENVIYIGPLNDRF